MKIAKILTLLAFIQCTQITHAMDGMDEEEEQTLKDVSLGLEQMFPSTDNNNQNGTPPNTQNNNPQQTLSASQALMLRAASLEEEEEEQFFKSILLRHRQALQPKQTPDNNDQNETPPNIQDNNPQQTPSEWEAWVLQQASEASKERSDGERSPSPQFDAQALARALRSDDGEAVPIQFDFNFERHVDEMRSSSNTSYPLENIPTFDEMHNLARLNRVKTERETNN